MSPNTSATSPAVDSRPYHVFISYSTADRVFVKEMAATLASHDLKVWFDENDLVPGSDIRRNLASAIGNSRTALICIGLEGYGVFQEAEVDAALGEKTDTEGTFRVIPVLLPGVTRPPKTLLGVDQNAWVKFFTNDPAEREALHRLRWGITGIKPQEPGPVLAVPEKPVSGRGRELTPVEQAIKNLDPILTTSTVKTVTYFVGPGVCFPPSTYSMTRGLLQELSLVTQSPIITESDILLPSIDLASSYYAAANGGDLAVLTKLFELFGLNRTDVPEAHLRLAKLLKLLEGRPAPRNPNPPRPLVVTTNFDLMLERALLREGVSFTRIVQHRSLPQLNINEYQVRREGDEVVFVEWVDGVDRFNRARREVGRLIKVPRDDFRQIDELILSHGQRLVEFPTGQRSEAAANPLASLSLKSPDLPVMNDEADDPRAPRARVPWPVLYKHHGSQDIEGSYALSADQYLEFVREIVLKGNVPTEILTQIKNSPIVFLGYSFLDPAFRLIYNTLLHDRIRRQENRLYAVQPVPQTPEEAAERRIEKLLWNELKNAAQFQMGVETIEVNETAFLDQVIGHVSRALGR